MPAAVRCTSPSRCEGLPRPLVPVPCKPRARCGVSNMIERGEAERGSRGVWYLQALGLATGGGAVHQYDSIGALHERGHHWRHGVPVEDVEGLAVRAVDPARLAQGIGYVDILLTGCLRALSWLHADRHRHATPAPACERPHAQQTHVNTYMSTPTFSFIPCPPHMLAESETHLAASIAMRAARLHRRSRGGCSKKLLSSDASKDAHQCS